MFYSYDPVSDFERHDADMEEALQKLPMCSECDEHIQSEYCFEVNDELICPDCMERNHRKLVDDIVC